MTVVTTERLPPTVGALVEGVDRERLATDDSFASGAWRRGRPPPAGREARSRCVVVKSSMRDRPLFATGR